MKKRMQRKEQETRVGGREGWPIKIIETAGRTLEQTLVNNDPFEGNACNDPKCVPSRDPKNKINCRRNTVCYRVTCRLCLRAGQRQNNLGSRVALLPGKFLRVRKVFARINEKTF